MNTKVKKWGNSLAIRLPEEIAKKVAIREDSEIRIAANSRTIQITTINKTKKSLKDLVSKITLENRHEEINFGSPVGLEQI